MKRILKIAAFALVMVLGSSLRNTVSAQNYDEDRDVSYQTFYDELSPYGRWIDYPGQGYVWVPDAGPDFRPYSTSGHWVWSDNYEWMWVSDYDWGWAPFHYGRWDNDPYYGWYWVPGYEWSPAWVAWRDGGEYYGWAPIRPGISININFNIGSYSPPMDFWCFAPRRYITSPRIYDYYVDRRQNLTIFNYTTIIVNNYRYGNNYGFQSGPRRYDAERYCGRINPVRFRQSYQPGRSEFRNNEVSIYRPNVRRDDNRSFSPQRFERYDRNSNSGFRRNDNNSDNRRVGNNPNNNLPVRREGNDNARIDRRDDNVRLPQNNNNSPAPRRLDRSDNRNDQQNRNGNNRVISPSERPDRNTNQGNNDNRRQDNNRVERRDNSNSNSPVVRQPQRQMERRQEPRQQPQQQIERRQESRQQPQQQTERRQEPRQQPQQQTERRQESRQQPQQQTERKQEPRQQTQTQQPRQFERRGDGNRPQNNNSGNNDNRSSRKRF